MKDPGKLKVLRIVTLSSQNQDQSLPESKDNHNHHNEESTTKNVKEIPEVEEVYDFRIIKNCGGGNCLFFTLDEFLHKKGGTDSFISDEDKIRTAVVDYITKPDRVVKGGAAASASNKNKKGKNQRSGKKFSENQNNNNNSIIPTTKFSNWKRYRQEIKINLEDHVRYFKLYNPSDDNEREEEIARNNYKKYMRRSGVYGTSAELLAAVENFGFTATIIAQDSSIPEKFVVYHLDGMRQGAYQTRRQRIYIFFTGHSTRGHFQLLEPMATTFNSENPSSPLPTGQYRVRGKCGPRSHTLTICEDVKIDRSDDNDYNNNQVSSSPPPHDNEENLKPLVIEDVKREEEQNQQNLKRKHSPSDHDLDLIEHPVDDDNNGDDGGEKNGTENEKNYHNHTPSLGSSILKVIETDEKLEEDDDNDDEEEDQESTLEKLMMDCHPDNNDDDDSKNTMKIDPVLVQAIEKILMSSEEFTTLLSRYCSKLIELQNQLLCGIGGGVGPMISNWSGIKVSNVWSVCSYHTNFILFQPNALKPLSNSNFRTHFVVYNQDSIFLTVENDSQSKRRALLLQNDFSLDEGVNYSLENTSDHPILMRVWWVSEHSSSTTIT